MKAIKVTVLALAIFAGLAGVVAAALLRQVPAGHRLSVDGAIYDDGVVYAPLWVESTLVPPAGLPSPPAAPAEPPTGAPSADLDGRLEAARAALAEAEQAAADAASETDGEFAAAERAHLDQTTERRLAGERRLAALDAETRLRERQRAAEADAEAQALLGEARAAFAEAEAERDRLLAQALTGEAGRYYVAIEAARRFRLGAVHLPDPPPDFLLQMGGVEAWRRVFLGRP